MAKQNGDGSNKFPKSYSRFTLKDVQHLGLEIKRERIFANIASVQPSAWLLETLDNEPDLVLESEQGQSGFIISPVVRELVKRNPRKITVFPGYFFEVEPEKGLTGICDFIFSKTERSALANAPIFLLVEAKNDNLKSGAGQCIAEMYAAQLFNKNEGKPQKAVYGAVTWGQQWQFYRLVGNTLIIDPTIYTLGELPQILGIFQTIIDGL